MKISKETNVAYIVTFIVTTIICLVNKLNFWVLIYFPILYFMLWVSIKEIQKQHKKRKDLNN